ncbi:MAG: hypothetical protein M5F18_02630 [Asgard group archaeon]|nr:hypothetical protein [Asgard group archaeon]
MQSCKRHEASDKLYVSQVDIGQESNIQICSGLVPFLPIEAMQDRRVVVVTNMKTRKLRGEPSMGMILAAEKDINEKLKVEPIIPPKSSIIGERLYFGGADSFEPPKLKDKAWEYIQPRMTTNSNKEVVFVNEEEQQLILRGSDENDSAVAETLINAKIL